MRHEGVCARVPQCVCVCKEREVDAWQGMNYHTSRSEGYRPANVSLNPTRSSATVGNGEIFLEIHHPFAIRSFILVVACGGFFELQ